MGIAIKLASTSTIVSDPSQQTLTFLPNIPPPSPGHENAEKLQHNHTPVQRRILRRRDRIQTPTHHQTPTPPPIQPHLVQTPTQTPPNPVPTEHPTPHSDNPTRPTNIHRP